jgi:hypothetical protein
MITILSRRRWNRLLVSMALLFMLTFTPGWLTGRPLSVAPALAQQSILPITSPGSCVSERSGGVVIGFDDLPDATHAADSYLAVGVRFLDDATTTPLIYGNIAERSTSSNSSSLDNDADTLVPGSAGVPLTIVFTNPQAAVGFFMGNATIPVSATLRAYDGAGTLLGTVITSVLNNDVDTFYGVSDIASIPSIWKVTLDYGQSGQSEEIDDLCFGNPQTSPPTRTFSGRVLQGARLGSPSASVGVPVSLYGSNDQLGLGALLGSSASVAGTGQYSVTTSTQYLYYTLVEGAVPQGFCQLSASAGMGGVAVDKGRIRYANPAPGTHAGNDFYIASGAICDPPTPIPLTAQTVPFQIPISQFPVIALPQSDLRATRIEVNQAIQNDANSVPQVIAKRTVVRVYVTSGSNATINNVLVRLRVFLNGNEALVTQARTHAVNSPLRSNINDSANFYLTVYSGSNAQVGFVAEVDPTGEITESNESNNRFPAAGTQNTTFQVRQGFTITYAPITYTYSGWDGPSAPTTRINTAIDWLRSIYPVPNASARSTVYYPYPGFSFNQEVNANDGALIGKLNTRWFLSSWGLQPLGWLLGINAGPSANQLYGWLPDGAYGGNGLSDPTWGGGNSHVAFGNDKPDKYRRTLAHEIGHNIAFCHNTRFIDTIGFDVLLNHTVKNTGYRDFMWPARREDEAWIDTTNYNRLFSRLAPGALFPPGVSACQTLKAASRPGAVIQQTTTVTGTHEFAFITGSVNITGTQGTLNPIYRDVREAANLPDSAGAQYCVVLLNAGSEVLDQHCFVPNFMNGDGATMTTLASFGFPMLWNPATVRIELRNGATVLAARDVSPNAPVVNLTSPNGGQSFAANANIPIAWTASDADQDALTYSLLYSPDGGTSWVPIADGLTTASYSLPAAVVAGSPTAIIRVIASDGANTGQDQSDAAFSVSKKPPQLYISAPISGTFVLSGTAVTLEGLGIDLEDGNLADADLQWTSSKDGTLGTGSSLILPSLSAGLHTLTLTGKDSDNNTVTATIQLFVGSQLHVPLLRR